MENPLQIPEGAARVNLGQVQQDAQGYITIGNKKYRLIYKIVSKDGKEVQRVRLDPTKSRRVYDETVALLKDIGADVGTLDKLVITKKAVKVENTIFIDLDESQQKKFQDLTSTAQKIITTLPEAEEFPPLEANVQPNPPLTEEMIKTKSLWQKFLGWVGYTKRKEISNFVSSFGLNTKDAKELNQLLRDHEELEQPLKAFRENSQDVNKRRELFRLCQDPKLASHFDLIDGIVTKGFQLGEVNAFETLKSTSEFIDDRIATYYLDTFCSSRIPLANMIYYLKTPEEKGQILHALEEFIETVKDPSTELDRKFAYQHLLNRIHDLEELPEELRQTIEDMAEALLKSKEPVEGGLRAQEEFARVNEFQEKFGISWGTMRELSSGDTFAFHLFMEAALLAFKKNEEGYDKNALHNDLLQFAFESLRAQIPNMNENVKNELQNIMALAKRSFSGTPFRNYMELFSEVKSIFGRELTTSEEDLLFYFMNDRERLQDLANLIQDLIEIRDYNRVKLTEGQIPELADVTTPLLLKYLGDLSLENPQIAGDLSSFAKELDFFSGTSADTIGITAPFMTAIHSREKLGSSEGGRYFVGLDEMQRRRSEFSPAEQELIDKGYTVHGNYWEKFEWRLKDEDAPMIKEGANKGCRIFKKGYIIRGYAIPGQEEILCDPIPIDFSPLGDLTFEQSEVAMRFIKYFLDKDTLENAIRKANTIKDADDKVKEAKRVFPDQYEILMDIAKNIYIDQRKKLLKGQLSLNHPEVSFDGIQRIDIQQENLLKKSLSELLGENFPITKDIERILKLIILNKEAYPLFDQLLSEAKENRQKNLTRLKAGLPPLPFEKQLNLEEIKSNLLVPMTNEFLEFGEQDRVEKLNLFISKILESAGIVNTQSITDPFMSAIPTESSEGTLSRHWNNVMAAKAKLNEEHLPEPERILIQQDFKIRGVTNVFEKFEVKEEAKGVFIFTLSFAIPGKEMRKVDMTLDLSFLKATEEEMKALFPLLNAYLTKSNIDEAKSDFVKKLQESEVLQRIQNNDTLQQRANDFWYDVNVKFGKALLSLGHPEVDFDDVEKS